MLYLLSCVLQPLHNCLQKAAKERGGVFYSSVDHYNAIASHCRALQVCMINFSVCVTVYVERESVSVCKYHVAQYAFSHAYYQTSNEPSVYGCSQHTDCECQVHVVYVARDSSCWATANKFGT